MVRNAGDMDANQVESSSSTGMTSSDDVMKLNGDVTMPLHNAAVADRGDATTTVRDGGAGCRGPAADMNGASCNNSK